MLVHRRELSVLPKNTAQCPGQRESSALTIRPGRASITCFMESPFIEKDKGPLKVLNLCLDSSNINSVLDLLRVILFAINHSETFVNSLFMFSSNRVTSLLAKVKS